MSTSLKNNTLTRMSETLNRSQVKPGGLQRQRSGSSVPGEKHPAISRVGEKNTMQQWAQMRVPHLFVHLP